jgi:hypothetical protein
MAVNNLATHTSALQRRRIVSWKYHTHTHTHIYIYIYKYIFIYTCTIVDTRGVVLSWRVGSAWTRNNNTNISLC